MEKKCGYIKYILMLVSVSLALTLAMNANGVEYYLRADTFTETLPGAGDVVMWGFAVENAFGEEEGELTSPGPEIVVPPGDTTLIIHLDNNLSVPVSLVIPGLKTTMVPVRNPDGRVRSFTHETPPENDEPVTYTWNDVAHGTYIYHSGTHPGIQVQMGLYGAVRKSFLENGDEGEAYEGVQYDYQVVVFLSEIDTVLHEAVATENYGPGMAITSPINYKANYFLVNGKPYQQGDGPLQIGNAGETTLIRLINAGLYNHAPTINGLEMKVIAEDGKRYSYPERRFSLTLPSLKTKDVLVIPSSSGQYVLYDRRLFLTNSSSSPGGMYLKLSAGE